MHKLYELKEMLCKELEGYGEKGELTAGSLDVVDKLAHAIKNIDKILDYDGEEYSNRYMYTDGRGTYARDGRSYGYSRRRDSRGRYSNDDGMIADLRELMKQAPDDRTRQEFQSFISRIENM